MNPYVSAEPPRVVVSAAAPRPACPQEPSHATPAVLPGTLAHALLSRWLAPLAANRAPARAMRSGVWSVSLYCGGRHS